MSTPAAASPPAPGPTREPAPRAPAVRRRLLWWLAAALAAWLVPLGAHLAGLDVLLPAALLAQLVGLQRGLPTVLDRLTVAAAQLFGALCAAGLLYSVWPWHLHPVPIAGTASSALLAVAALTRRRWTPPRRGRRSDLAVALAVGAVTVLTVMPFAVRDLGARLGIVMIGEDLVRHFVVYDTIGQVGGYLFLHADSSAAFLPADMADGIRAYPQGTHFGYAVLDRFIRADSANTDGITQLSVLLWLYVATFAFLALAVLWSLRRVAGPGPRPVRLVPVLGLAALWLYFGDPLGVFIRGFPNELVGLALCALLTAVVVRPLTARGDQLVTVLLLLVGISFSYHLFLPYAFALAAVWAWRDRGWWLAPRHRAGLLGAAAAAAVAAPAVALTPWLNLHATTARQLSASGTALPTDRPAVVLLVALVVVGLAVRGGPRSPARRVAGAALAANLGVLLLLGGFQLLTLGRTIYYFDKVLHLTIVVGLVLLGPLARLLPAGAPIRSWDRRRLAFAAAAFVLAAGLMGAGGAGHAQVPSHGVRLATGAEKGSPAGGRDALLIARRHPDGGAAVDVDLMDTPYRNWYGTFFASAIQRNYRYGHAWYDFQHPTGRPRTLADLEAAVVDSPVPVRFYVYNPRASMLVRDPAHPNRQWTRPGADPAAFGDPEALTNVAAAEDLARRYPGRVEVVYAVPPDR
jgi:hypothetical protein